MQSPIQQVPGANSPGVTRPWSAADHSPSSSSEVNNIGAIPPLRLTSFREYYLIN
jgi:hypothetical protein